MVRQKLLNAIEQAVLSIDGRSPMGKWLREAYKADKLTLNQILEVSIAPMVSCIGQSGNLTDTASAIGKRLRKKAGLPLDTRSAVVGGCTIVNSYILSDLVYLKASVEKNSKHSVLKILLKDDENFQTLVEETNIDSTAEDTPYNEPVPNWTEGINNDVKLIRDSSEETTDKVSIENMPKVFKALNKLQQQGYIINSKVLEVYEKLIVEENVELSPFKFMKEFNPQARKSMKLEASIIKKMAEKQDANRSIFYHMYNCDFRGRIYPTTIYLHEQSSDNAKGLLLYNFSERVEEEGLYWLAVHTANSFGYDKVSLDKRVDWVNSHMSEMLIWASSPTEYRGWCNADKPWSFLACCFEWERLNKWIEKGNNPNDFWSNLPIFIDGSNNGIQHLTAMVKDEKSAPLVNLSTADQTNNKPGDIYLAIADSVWNKLEKLADPNNNIKMKKYMKDIQKLLSKREKATNIEDNAKRKEAVDKAYEEYFKYTDEHREEMVDLWPNFWLQFKSKRRKIVKRPVMTLGYGVTRAGCREQIFDDTKGLGDENLRLKYRPWTNKFADLVLDTCLEDLKGPAFMLKLFKTIAEESNSKVYFEDKTDGHKALYDSPEECADMMTLKYLKDISLKDINGCLNSTESSIKFKKKLNVNIEPQYLSWLVPTTNFPVIQDYIVNKITRLNVYMGKPTKKNPRGVRRSLRVQIEEKVKVDKGAQLSGAAPNIVHSLDAAHLTNIVANSNFATTVIHDSFGCHISNMRYLFQLTRIEFVNLYKTDPLENLLIQFKAQNKQVKYGNLDITIVEKSDFAFC